MGFDEYIDYKGKEIKIVIVDSGLSPEYNVEKSGKIEGYSVINNNVVCDNFEDKFGHGTAVYSLIRKIVPEAEIIIVKIFDNDFVCSQGTLDLALEYIYNNITCDIVNISAGTCILESDKLYNICKKLYEKGVIIVAAYDNIGTMSFPASFDIVIGVDGSLDCKTINEFEYIRDSEINIRAKAGMHRVAWTSPRYIFVEGTSFSIAYVTAMVAKILESGCNKLDLIKEIFENNSICVYYNDKVYESYNEKPFQIQKAIVFPYSKEIDSLIRFDDLTNFDIIAICDYKLSGKVGMKINKQEQFVDSNIEKEYIMLDIEKLDWNIDFDTVILGYTDKISKMLKYDYTLNILKKCIKYRKNIYLFDYDPKYDQYINEMKKDKLKVFYPRISETMIPRNRFGKMYRNYKPIIGVFGTSSHQGKYTILLELIRILSNEYKIATIGTEPTAPLFGMDLCFPMGYHSSVYTQSYDSIFLLNDMIHSLSVKEPDLILVGSQYATIPFDVANINMFTNNQYDFLMGTQPEAILLTINSFDSLNYIRRTILFLESTVDAKVIALIVYPVDVTHDWTEFYGKKQSLSRVKYEKLKHDYEAIFSIPVFCLNDAIDGVANVIIDYFS